jgi:hypothetical protein
MQVAAIRVIVLDKHSTPAGLPSSGKRKNREGIEDVDPL